MSTPINQLTETYFKNKTNELEADAMTLLNNVSLLIISGKPRNSVALFNSIQNEIQVCIASAEALKADWDVWLAATPGSRPGITLAATNYMIDKLDFVWKMLGVVWGLAIP